MRTALGRIARTLGWLVLTTALAVAGAGLVAQVSPPPGDQRREELTYAADAALAVQLDAVNARLTAAAQLVDQLSADARSTLVAVASADGTALAGTLAHGTAIAGEIDATAAAIQSTLDALPGADASATASYSNAALVRRAALASALDAVSSLGAQWAGVSSRANSAALLTNAIQQHDATVAAAAAKGVVADYAGAVDLLKQATELLVELSALRQQVVPATGTTVLDTWISVHTTYDEALSTLYSALVTSGGKRNPVVDAAYRAENQARQSLPPDNRAILVIVSEVAQGGLDQGVAAIEEARGRIDQALATTSPGQSQPAGPG